MLPGPLRNFAARHPVLTQVIWWTLPAILFGALLRLLLLRYQPYAYWGSDSHSYFSFGFRLLTSGDISLPEKRRYLYPIFLLPVSMLPGSPLRWLAWIQHGIGLATLLPLGFIVRKSLVHWRWLIVPITVIYAGVPLVIWYEHELLAESLLFASVVWTAAGWVAWQTETQPDHARRLWWTAFFIPLLCMTLMKPSARFIWPGLLLAFVMVRGWKKTTWRQGLAAVALFAAGLTVGQESQGAWLLYSTAFPLTRLDTPSHADYKNEVRGMVTKARGEIGNYPTSDAEAKAFLKHPEKEEDKPLWKALGANKELQTSVYRDLALEGICSRPDLFLFIAFQRIVESSNLEDFKDDRFASDFYIRKFEHLYERYTEEHPRMAGFLFGLGKKEKLPGYALISRWLSPRPNGFEERSLRRYVKSFQESIPLVHPPDRSSPPGRFRLSFLGWWFFAGSLLAFFPKYRDTVGSWMLVMWSYLFGVFLVGSANARFFAPVWPLILLAMAVAVDFLLCSVIALKNRFQTNHL